MTLKDDKKTAVCSLCNMQLSFSHRSTTSLIRHLKTKHPIELDAEDQRQKEKAKRFVKTESECSTSNDKPEMMHVQQTLAASFERKEKYKPGSGRKRLLDQHLLDLVATDMQPLSVVDNRGFRKFVNALDPKYEMASRKTLTTQLLPERYKIEKAKLMNELT